MILFKLLIIVSLLLLFFRLFVEKSQYSQCLNYFLMLINKTRKNVKVYFNNFTSNRDLSRNLPRLSHISTKSLGLCLKRLSGQWSKLKNIDNDFWGYNVYKGDFYE